MADEWVFRVGHTSTVWGLATDPLGNRIATASDDKTVIIWARNHGSRNANGESNEWQQVATLTGFHERTIFSIDWSREGNFLATGAGDDTVRIFTQADIASNAFDLVQQQPKAHTSDVNCVRWCPQLCEDKKSILLASAGDDAVIRLWKFTPAE
jgi:cytosolic iron-sulfur protein assembly protein CIAO1